MSKKTVQKISTLGSRITSIVSVSLVLLVIGALGLTGVIAESLSRTVRDNVSVIVKMDPLMPDSVAREFSCILDTVPFSASYIYTSAADIFAQEAADNPDILEFGENPFSAEYEVRMSAAYADADSVAAVSQRLEALDSVDEVVTRIDTIHTINTFLHRAMLVLGCAALALLFISVILIFNTVSLSVYSRRFTIHTMQLVGATPAFIRRPFVGSAIVWGVVSGLIASTLLLVAVFYARTTGIEIFLIPGALCICALCAALVVLGVAICAVSALIATNRYIVADYDDLYK